MEFRPFVNSSLANRPGKSFSLDNPTPTYARDFSRTLDTPKRRLKNVYPGRDIRASAPKDAINISGSSAKCSATFPKNKVRTRAKWRDLQLQAPPSERVHRVQEISLQGSMKYPWCTIQNLRRRIQFPNAASALGIPIHGIAKQNSATEAISLQKGILYVWRHDLEVRRLYTYAPRGVDASILQVRALISLSAHLLAIHHFPSDRPTWVNNSLARRSPFLWLGNLEYLPIIGLPLLGRTRQTPRDVSSALANSCPGTRLHSSAIHAENAASTTSAAEA